MDFTQEEKETLFEQDKTQTYTSDHYVFHFQSGSLAEKEILLIAHEQEQCFSKICNTLKVAYPRKIHYYFTSSPLEIGRVFWEEGTPCNGVALCGRSESKIYSVYNETVKCIGSHEDTHLISFEINYPESDFIVEGLAMCMDDLWWGLPNEVWTAYHKHAHPELSINSLLDNTIFAKYGCIITYPIAGAFTRFLIDTYGVDQFTELYKYDGCDYGDIVKSIFHVTITELENSFWAQISSTLFDASVLEEMLRAEGCL